MYQSLLSEHEKESAFSDLCTRFVSAEALPLSFLYGGTRYHGFPSPFVTTRAEDSDQVCWTARHPDGLCATLHVTFNREYGQCEWSLRFVNESEHDSSLLEEVCSADFSFAGENPTLTFATGDTQRPFKDAYAFSNTELPMMWGTTLSFMPPDCRSTVNVAPYYRLAFGNNTAILALGWHGQWRTTFTAGDKTVNFRASQANLSAVLHPGETLITPTVCLLQMEGRDRYRAINHWRRWYHACACRLVEGELMKPKRFTGAWMSGRPDMNEETMLEIIRLNQEKKVHYSLFWMDAGWYFFHDDVSLPNNISYWSRPGTWKVDTHRFPTGLKAVTDALVADGAEGLLWFEPERVAKDTAFYGREFCFSAKSFASEQQNADMGNPVFREEMLAAIDKVMQEGGIALYRQDMNFKPNLYWEDNDRAQGEHRRGMTENRYVAGILAYYDEILRRHPKYPLDMCAGGGTRFDLEAAKRCIMLTLTDTPQSDTVMMQNMRLGRNEWFSLFGGGCPGEDLYTAQSNLAPFYGLNPSLNYLREKDQSVLNAHAAKWERINHLFYADFYPLTAPSPEETVWVAWEFYDPDRGEGFVQAFRRKDCEIATEVFRLHGIDPASDYEWEELNTGTKGQIAGAVLCEQGLSVTLPEKRSCALFVLKTRKG
ncbi:MAG: alpha-galactosidase [Ruminococcaceae bacterium]|nr:alpha-galactosidase [Oscillospiraceae bacterium]